MLTSPEKREKVFTLEINKKKGGGEHFPSIFRLYFFGLYNRFFLPLIM